MHLLSTNQLRFSVTVAVATFLFQASISYATTAYLYTATWSLALLFFVVMFAAGWIFGSRDKDHLPLANIAIRFHVLTFLIYNGVTILWYALSSKLPDLSSSFFISVGLWGVGLLLHIILFWTGAARRIRGLGSKDLFD